MKKPKNNRSQVNPLQQIGMTTKMQKVASRRWIEKWSRIKIAKEMGMSVSAVKKMLWRAKKVLKRNNIPIPNQPPRSVTLSRFSTIDHHFSGIDCII